MHDNCSICVNWDRYDGCILYKENNLIQINFDKILYGKIKCIEFTEYNDPRIAWM